MRVVNYVSQSESKINSELDYHIMMALIVLLIKDTSYSQKLPHVLHILPLLSTIKE